MNCAVEHLIFLLMVLNRLNSKTHFAVHFTAESQYLLANQSSLQNDLSIVSVNVYGIITSQEVETFSLPSGAFVGAGFAAPGR